jgi:DNA-binding NtrC family response regulator
MSIPVPLCGKRVFVVDDEANIADTLSLILRGVGFTVRTFYDGLTALEHAQHETPDFVISDIIMPKMDGFSLAVKLREQLPHCRVLLISGNAGYSTLLSEWRDHGGPELEILAKPVGPQFIICKLTAMVAAANADDHHHDCDASRASRPESSRLIV